MDMVETYDFITHSVYTWNIIHLHWNKKNNIIRQLKHDGAKMKIK